MSAASLCRIASLVALAVAACGEGSVPTAPEADRVSFGKNGGARPSLAPTGTGIGTRTDSIGPRTTYRTEYHGGPVMVGTVRVYFIWYGTWGTPTNEASPTEVLLTDLVASLSGTPYYRIHTLYTDGSGARPSGGLMWGRNIYDRYSHGIALSEADVGAIISSGILSGQLPLDSNGIYVVVGSPDVSVGSGLGTSYCALHLKRVSVAGISVAQAFLGSAERNPAKCAPQLSSPNGDWVGDAMASTLMAIISNAVTDPDHNGWYDRIGLEPGDKCAWNFGPTYQAPNGALANIRLGSRDYLLQKLWVPGKANSGYCALAIPGS